MKDRISILLGAIGMGLIFSCSIQKKSEDSNIILDHLDFRIEKAEDWTRLFFRKSGWFGGDGIFSVTRNGVEKEGEARNSETFIWFSDTLLGEIEEDSLSKDWKMINNSIAVLQGGVPEEQQLNFFWNVDGSGKAAALFTPQTSRSEDKDYYWLGDGFVNHQKNNDLYIFGYRVQDTDPNVPFGFKEMGNTLVVVPAEQRPPFHDVRQLDIPFFSGEDIDDAGTFGAGVLVNTIEAGAIDPDGFVYIYGVRGMGKNVMVARVLPQNIEVFDQWTFWNGEDWVSDPAEVQTITDRVSNELSVTPLEDGRYAMIFQVDGISPKIGLRLGETPVGPFGPIIELYDVSKDIEKGKNIYPYNAKAHPVLSEPGELLISYNVNSFDFFRDIWEMPNLYRPRFIKLKYEL